ncbi:hypothetical protein FB45DRAFT_886457 [Roridomyces roridus]|uniref:Zn(2)-C6 fungal-type domain-containing protein n=1 Tax=Roridomyces roridus TaxID=1738132 RepID=A0AAD7CIH7_9AGAR|nr:hypothetical protein FB45DRAFT_886457 [Roridomyces roridus]
MEAPSRLQQSTTEPSSSRHLFQNAAEFTISGGQFVSGDVHYHAITPPPAFDLQVDVNASAEATEDSADSDVYCRQLLGRRRGFPLYVPAPQRNLPEEYQRKGISIGDVGRVTPEGVFDFFFNVYLASDHPVNCGLVPEEFVPLAPFLDQDILELDFERDSHVASPSVLAWGPYHFSDDFRFTCKGPRGAVLALPLGSRLMKLQNVEDMRRYAARNAESWYRYINGSRGRGLRNGGLHLVTGFEKSWEGGLASFQNIGAGSEFSLVFRPMDHRFQTGTPAITKSFQTPPDNPVNHTVFFHGFTISLGEGIWGRLLGTVEVSDAAISPKSPSSIVPFGSQSSLISWIVNLSIGAGSSGGKTYSGKDGEEVTLSDLASIPEIFHPSRLVNNFILDQVPNAEVVITHDEDWCDIISENGVESIQEQKDLLDKVARQFFLAERDGAYFLASSLPPPYPSGSAGPQNFPLSRSGPLLDPQQEVASLLDAPHRPFDVKRRSLKKMSLAQSNVGSSAKHFDPQESNTSCLFCRSRKLMCGPSSVASSSQCGNCERRNLECEYPMSIEGSSQSAGSSSTAIVDAGYRESKSEN